jgi:hypothetical protein
MALSNVTWGDNKLTLYYQLLIRSIKELMG